MPLRVPPPEIPVISWLSPNKADQGLLEFWNTEVASYSSLDVGAAHPNQRQYPNFRLGKQAPVQGDEKWVLRTWVTDETSPDWFNWAAKFSGEDNAFPIFIRTYREPRATYTPRVKGTPLGTLYKTVMTNVGSGYSNGALPSVTFDEPVVTPTTVAVGHAVVNTDGSITEVILDFGGEGYAQDVEFSVAVPINGDQAFGVAYVQPQIAVLVREEASLFPPDSEFYAQYLQVTRIYETIPGPTFYETSLDIDGMTLTTATTRKFCDDIVTGEDIDSGTWCKTTKKPTDIDVICQEVVVCRAIPGNVMTSTLQDEDGKFITRTQQYIETSTGLSEETLVTGVWHRKHIEDVDGTNLVSWQWIDDRAIPGEEIDEITFPYGENGKRVTARKLVDRSAYSRTPNGTANSNFGSALLVDEKLESVQNSLIVARKLGTYDQIPVASNQQGLGYFVEYPYDGDPDFPRLTWRFQILRLDVTTVADLSACPISGFTSLLLVDQKTEEADELIEVKVVRTYEVLPGKPIPKTALDKYSNEVEEVRTKKDESTIVTQESTAGNIWTKTTKEPIGGGVAWEVVQAIDLAIANTVSSAAIDGDQEVENISQRLRIEGLITPSSTEAGGFITNVEKVDVGSDLVSEQRTTVTKWLDKAVYSVTIPDGIIPLEFRAAIPTVVESHILSGTASMPTLSGNEFSVQERQLTENLYERRTESLGTIGFPIIQTNYETTEEYGGGILQIIRTLHNVLLTVDSGESVVHSEVREIGQSYLWFKETSSRFDPASAWPTLTEYDQDPETQSLITTTYQVIAVGSVVAPSIVTGVITRFKKIDKWRSLQIVETYSLPATYSEQRFMAYTFPSLWDWTTYNYNTACGAVGPIRHGFSTMVNARLDISFSTAVQSIDGLTLIPNTHHLVHDIINAVLNDAGVIFYFGTCSGPVTLVASSPDYTTYTGTYQNTVQLISGESVRWRAGLYKNSRLYVTML